MILNNRKLTLKFSYLMVIMMSIGFLSDAMFLRTFAEVTEATARSNLVTSVADYVAQQEYQAEKGGYILGSDIFNCTNGETFSEGRFNSLSPEGQRAFVADIEEASNIVNSLDRNVADNETGFSTAKGGSWKPKGEGVTDDTVTMWWGELQAYKGIGSKFLVATLQDTKPDFATGRKWYKPFSGPISSVLGFGSILILGIIGVVMIADILYITVPPLRLAVDDSGADGKIQTSKFFSHAAIAAVKEAEEGSGNGSGKQALGLYFKSRALEMFLLVLALIYLVNGKLYTVIAKLMDTLAGFL